MLGTLLLAAGYTADGLKDALGTQQSEVSTAAADIPAHLQRLTDSNPRHSLIKLFFLGVPLEWKEVAA